jgi:hypothetical protein
MAERTVQGLNIDTWYKALLGVALAMAALAGVMRSEAFGFLAFGVACIGLSAFAGETKQQVLMAATVDFPGGIITRTRFQPRPIAVLFAVMGILLLAWGGFLEVRRELHHVPRGDKVAAGHAKAEEGEGRASEGGRQR